MAESINLPPGFRFNPFEEELINLYLKPKVLGQNLPCNVVEERQLYGPNANPWQVFHPENYSWILSEITPGKFEKVTYVFVNLIKQATVERKNMAGRNNYIKKAGCGTWGGKTSRNEIRDSRNGDLIGEKRMLVFEINEDPDQDLSKVGYWKMHEFHLRGVNADIINPNNTVLCKITFDCSKNPFLRLPSKINHNHPETSSSKPQKKDPNVDRVSSPPTMNSGLVDGNQCVSENNGESITTETRREDLIVCDSCRVKGVGYGGTENIEICDEVELTVEEISQVTASSTSEQLDPGYLKPAASDFCWPGYNNDYKKIIKEELSVEDTTTNLGKRKLKVETSCSTAKKLKPESSDFSRPGKHDHNYQKIKEEAGGRENFYSGISKAQFSSYPRPKEEQSVEDTNLGTRNVKVETPGMMTKNLSPSVVIID